MTNRFEQTVRSLAAALLLSTAVLADEPAKKAEAKPEAAPAATNGNGNGAECEACEEEEEEGPSCTFLNDLLIGKCFSENTGISASGWTVMSFTFNPDDPADRYNGPVTMNDRSNQFLLNQQYLTLQRAVDTEGCGIDIGGRVDVVYGSDATFTQAFGLDHDIFTDDPIYRLALPQMYFNIWMPVAEGLDIKVGHFYTILGYEVYTTPDNFFTTLPYTFQYGEPFTHTGIMAQLKLNDEWLLHNCLVRGWDSWHDNNNAVSYMGGVTWTPSEETNVTYNFIVGPEQDEPNILFQGIADPGLNITRFSHALVIQQQLTEDLKYVFQSDYGVQSAGAGGILGIGPTPHAEWYGVNQYLLYTINDCWSAGIRGEWFRDDDGQRVSIARAASTLSPAPGAFAGFFGPGDYYEVALGLNYKPTTCLTIRPELRWDWQTPDTAATVPAYDNQTSRSQFISAIDVILKY